MKLNRRWFMATLPGLPAGVRRVWPKPRQETLYELIERRYREAYEGMQEFLTVQLFGGEPLWKRIVTGRRD